MKRFACFLCFFLLAAAPLPGQEDPGAQLELFQGLRDRGYFELAEEQLKKLGTLPDADIKARLPLESARLQIAWGRSRPAEARGPYFDKAGKELQAFIKANAGKPEAAQAQLELARLYSSEAEALLTKAMQEPTKVAGHALARPAEKKFLQAGAELEQVAKTLGTLADSFKGADPKEEKRVRQLLNQDHWQARLERAANYIDQARTYINTGDSKINQARTARIVEARKAFEAIYNEAKEPWVHAVARAWVGKCAIETDDPGAASKHLDAVIGDTSKNVQAGQRLARYFYIQWVPTNPKIKGGAKERDGLIEKLSLAWIRDYPAHLKTPEGQGVQFELAETYFREASALWQGEKAKAIAKEKDPKKKEEMERKLPPSKVALDLFEKAQKYYETVAAGESDFAERANQQSMSIAFLKIGEGSPIAALPNFPGAFLRAQYELMRMHQAGEEKERQNHLRQAIQALRRGLALADARTPPSKVDEARYLLTTAYLVQGDLERAAVMGEFLARLRPATRRSPGGAGFALEAYSGLLQRENTTEMRDRLVGVAQFILSEENQKIWKNEPATALAHFQLAMTFYRDVDEEGTKIHLKDTVKHLEQISPDYPGYLFAQGQLVFVAMEARDQKGLEPKRREEYTKTAKAALARLKDLPPNPDAPTASMFFSAKMQNAQFIHEEAEEFLTKKQLPNAAKSFQAMAVFLDTLKAQLDKVPEEGLSDEVRDPLIRQMGNLRKYATLGLAEVEYRGGDYKKVLSDTLTGPTLAMVQKLKPAEDGKVRIKDFQVTSQLLAMALRAQVQTGKITEARDTFRILESLAGEEGDIGAGLTNVFARLVDDLQNQVRDLKAAGDAKRLAETVKNFSEFLELRSKKLLEAKTINPRELGFLASAYAGLDLHDRAADLYRRIPPPAALAKPPKSEMTQEEEMDIYRYWTLQIEFARTLRLSAANLKEADKKEETLTEANKVLDGLMKHPQGRMHLMAKEERLYVWEEAGRYGSAIKGWTEFMNEPFIKDNLTEVKARPLLFNRRAKDVYFKAFYHYGYAVYKYAQSDAGKKAGAAAEYTNFAAKHFLRLKQAANQEGWEIVRPYFEDFCDKEPVFRDAFAALEKAETK